MKPTLLILLLSTISAFAGLPWPGVAYTEVRAFAWDPRATPHGQLIRADMSFADGVINKEGALLSVQQVKRVLVAEARRYKDRAAAACYDPHNAFVFYNAEKKPVAYLEICFDCLGARPSPRDDKCDPDFSALASICAELNLPFGEAKTLQEFQTKNQWLFKPDKLRSTTE